MSLTPATRPPEPGHPPEPGRPAGSGLSSEVGRPVQRGGGSDAGRQLSLFGVEAADPSPADLAGLLAGPGRISRMGGTARVCVVVDAGWRVHVLVAELARRGLAATWARTADGRLEVRTAYTSALAPLAAAWLGGGVQRPPATFFLSGPRLRLWVAAAGSPAPAGYLLRLRPPDSRPPDSRPPDGSAAATDVAQPGPGGADLAADSPAVEPDGPDVSTVTSATGPDLPAVTGERPARPDLPAVTGERRAGPDLPAVAPAELAYAVPDGPPGPAEAARWELVGAALAAVGLPGALLGPRAGGPGFRLTGRRRLARLAELVGDRPPAAPPDAWPGV